MEVTICSLVKVKNSAPQSTALRLIPKSKIIKIILLNAVNIRKVLLTTSYLTRSQPVHRSSQSFLYSWKKIKAISNLLTPQI